MFNRSLVLIGALLLTVPAVAQVPTQTEINDGSEKFLGSLLKDVYTNDFFHFRLTKPATMFVLSEEQNAAYKAAGTELLRADSKMGRAAWEKAATAEVVVFSLTDKDPALGVISSLNIGALRQASGVTASGVCNATRDFLIENPKITVLTDTRSTKLVGKDAAVIDFRLTTAGEPAFIRYYALMVRGHSLTFVVTYFKKEELDRLEGVLRTLEFFA